MKTFIITFFVLLSLIVANGDEIGHKAHFYTVGEDTPYTDFDFAEIQPAINACYDGGGTIWVDGGNYDENLVINGTELALDERPITIEYVEVDTPTGPCYINGKNNTDMPAILILNANVKIEGFEIINGRGYSFIDNGYQVYRGGGIAACPKSWLAIRHCNINNNEIKRDYTAYSSYLGGGVYVGPLNGLEVPSLGYRINIFGCFFDNNRVEVLERPTGANLNAYGGGLCCLGLNMYSKIEANTFNNNYSNDYAGGAHIGESFGVAVNSNIFSYNNVDSDAGGYGNPTAFMANAGITAPVPPETQNTPGGKLNFVNNRLHHNGSVQLGHQANEVIYIGDIEDVSFCNNTITDNNSSYALGVVRLDARALDCYFKVWQNIICENLNNTQLYLLAKYEKTLEIDIGLNSFYNSSPPYVQQYSGPEVGIYEYYWYNNGSYWPKFGGFYNLQQGSECIDAGLIKDYTEPAKALEAKIPGHCGFGNERPLDGDGNQEYRYDIGAHEYVYQDP